MAHAGVPHYLGPRISFIEVQEPSDHIVIAETSGDDDAGATMGLGWDLALDMIDYTANDADQTFAAPVSSRENCAPAAAPAKSGCSRTTCSRSSTPPRWRWQDEIETDDGRFSVAIVVSGDGCHRG